MSAVTLHVYDLSQGMAKAMSLALTGRQFDGIWHTGVVVFGREYFFGGGIQEGRPGLTPYGTPTEVLPYGETTKTHAELIAHLRTLRAKYTAETYHLLNNNCNNFADDCCKFLLNGKGLPAHIVGLPQDFLSTPFGQMVRPMIEGMMGRVTGSMMDNMHGGAPGPSGSAPAVVQRPAAPPATTFPRCRSRQPVLFAAANGQGIIKKLRAFVEECGVAGAEEHTSTLSFFVNTPETHAPELTVYDAIEWFFEALPPEKMFPVLDVLRLCVLREAGNQFYAAEDQNIVQKVLNVQDTAGGNKAVNIMASRIIANMFAFPAGGAAVLRDIDAVVDRAIQTLRTQEAGARQAAAAALRNCAMLASTSEEHAEAALQILVAAVEFVQGEEDTATVFHFLLTVGSLTVDDGSHRELSQQLGFSVEKYLTSSDADVAAVAQELQAIFRG